MKLLCGLAESHVRKILGNSTSHIPTKLFFLVLSYVPYMSYRETKLMANAHLYIALTSAFVQPKPVTRFPGFLFKFLTEECHIPFIYDPSNCLLFLP